MTPATAAEPTPEDVQGQMRDTRRHMSGQMHALGDKVAGMAQDAADAVDGAARGVRGAVSSAAGQLREAPASVLAPPRRAGRSPPRARALVARHRVRGGPRLRLRPVHRPLVIGLGMPGRELFWHDWTSRGCESAPSLDSEGNMIPIYFDELAEVLGACTRLRPDECSPAHLKALMADHLAQTDPGLADKVLAFDGPQLLALSAFVLQAQALVGMSKPALLQSAEKSGA